MSEQKQTRKQRWMETFQGYVLEAMPGHKIEWYSAEHFYNLGMESDAAAFKYIANRKED